MANVQIIGARAALEQACQTLRIRTPAVGGDTNQPLCDSELLMQMAAATARRLCGFMCPCAPRDVITAIERSLSRLADPQLDLRAIARDAIDDLLASGDLLELDQVKLVGADHEPNWLFCAPPSFIPRGKRIYITGIAPDDASFLTLSLRERVVCEGGTRFISLLGDDGNLEPTLASHGLRRLDPQRWLAGRQQVKASVVVSDAQRRLLAEGSVGHLEGLSVLTHRHAQRKGYSARWRDLKDESGLHIARLPKTYGSALWVLIDAERGVVKRSLLLPLRGSRSRACDDAWRLQLAIDAHEGHPAGYRIQKDGDGASMQGDFPLPMEARRRLVLIGGRRQAVGQHYGYWIPQSQLEAEERYLQQHLWFQRADTLEEAP
jgi:hypothetical protein